MKNVCFFFQVMKGSVKARGWSMWRAKDVKKGMKEEEDGIQLFDAAEDDDMKADDLPPSSNSTDEDWVKDHEATMEKESEEGTKRGRKVSRKEKAEGKWLLLWGCILTDLD